MVTRCIPIILALALFVPPRAYAQSAGGGGYLSVTPAVSAGDGGAAPSVSASAGYVTPHRIGFEVEFAYTDRLNLHDERGPQIDFARFPAMYAGIPGSPVTGSMLDQMRALGLEGLYALPQTDLSVSGRLLSIQTNAVGELVTTRHFRAIVSGGGGAATLRQRMHMHISPLGIPVVAGMPGLQVMRYDSTVSVSDTGLSLDAGMTLEYRLMHRLGLAGDVRYQHVFVNPGGLDLARVGGRLLWRF